MGGHGVYPYTGWDGNTRAGKPSKARLGRGDHKGRPYMCVYKIGFRRGLVTAPTGRYGPVFTIGGERR